VNGEKSGSEPSTVDFTLHPGGKRYSLKDRET